MSELKVFLTGATGFVGGEVLYHLDKISTPNLAISCLVRSEDKEKLVQNAYPKATIVRGDLDDVALIEAEARKSDVVLHIASTSHLASAQAIAKGLSSKQNGKAHWIQMSGASMLAIDEIKASKFGQPSDASFDDLADTQKVLSLLEANPSRAVDNFVLSQDASKIRTALIVGPLIYGQGQGPVNCRSIQAPEVARNTIAWKEGFTFGTGLSRWSNVHVSDLADLIVRLVKAAASGRDGVWNKDGIYFPENGILSFGELFEQVAKEAHKQGLIPSAEVQRKLSDKDADTATARGTVFWGTNAVLGSSRARKLLDWNPSGPSLEDTIPDIVRVEAQSA